MDGRTKVSPAQVVEMREAYATGTKQKEIAERYGVHSATVSRLVRGSKRCVEGGPIAEKKEARSERFWYDVSEETGCWSWNGRKNPGGYGIHATAYDHGYSQLAHKFFYQKYVGPVPEGFEVDHTCRNRLCVNPRHLEAVTPTINARRSSWPKLTEVQVAEIKQLYSAGSRTQQELAECYGVDRSTVQAVTSGRTWSDVGDQSDLVRRQYRKLTAEQVVEIRELYARGGVRHRDLAEQFGGLNPVTIHQIVRGKTWKGAGGPISPGRSAQGDQD